MRRSQPGKMPARPGNVAVMKTLDDIDRRLLALLQDDARLPTVALAKAVGLSRSAVQERMQRLHTSGVIERYTLRLGARGPQLRAWLCLRYAEGFSCDDVVPLLAELPQVQRCDSLAGDIDLLVEVATDSAAELGDLRERVLALKGVDDVTTRPVLRTVLDRH